jgi:hypothetical protein
MDTTRGRGRSPKLAKMMDGHGAGVRDAVKKSKDSTTPINKATLSALMKYGFEPALPDALERCVYLVLSVADTHTDRNMYLCVTRTFL